MFDIREQFEKDIGCLPINEQVHLAITALGIVLLVLKKCLDDFQSYDTN